MDQAVIASATPSFRKCCSAFGGNKLTAQFWSWKLFLLDEQHANPRAR